MTQDEPAARDDSHLLTDDTPSGPLAAIKAQGPVRLAALGLAFVAAAGFVGAQFIGGADPVQVSQVAPVSANPVAAPRPKANDLPTMPQPPAAVAALASPAIRSIQAVEPTLAVVSREASKPTSATCDVRVEVAPLAGAMVALDIAAPCDPSARVDIFQGDLQIAIPLDEVGQAQVEMPTLTATSTLAVVVSGRAPVSLLTDGSDVADYDRTVLFWQGDMGLELHAFENDADYGMLGHVSPRMPSNIAKALSGNGGYLQMLGDPTLAEANVALVYTVPASVASDLSVEAPVLAGNCTRDVLAGTIRSFAGAAPVLQDLTFTMPDCDAVGDYVLLGDPTAAAVQIASATK